MQSINAKSNWAQRMKDFELAALYCSDLLRATETAETLLDGLILQPQPMADLRERNMGDWEGLSWEDVTRRYPEDSRRYLKNWAGAIPGGESLSQMKRRVLAAWKEIWSHSWDRAMIIAHGGTNRILLAEFLGIPDHNFFRIAQDHLRMNWIEFTEGTPTVKMINSRISS
jgi:broad specificity phosphatase PhoE